MRAWMLTGLAACAAGPEAVDSDVTPLPDVDPWADALAAFPDLDPARCAPPPAFDGRGFDPAAPALAGDPLIAKVVPVAAILAHDDVGDASGPVAAAQSEALACDGDVACVRAAVFEDLEGAPLPAGVDVAALAARVRAIGTHPEDAGGTDAALASAAWAGAVADLVQLFDRYAASGPALAGVVEAVDAAGLAAATDLAAAVVAGLMRADGRDDAGRYEPMAEGVNAPALAALGDPDAFPFAAIVVPGQGPADNDPDTVITSQSMFRADLGAARWKAGVAPVVLVSGGHVHPDRTPYSEAIEMKRYLIETHDLPEGAVLVDPHARHTTTNVRNASRILLRAGVSPDKPMLTTTDLGQSAYIALLVAQRSEEELGYVPWRGLTVLGPQDNCVFPTARSLSVDARDPLDP